MALGPLYWGKKCSGLSSSSGLNLLGLFWLGWNTSGAWVGDKYCLWVLSDGLRRMWHSRWHSEAPAVPSCLPSYDVPAPLLKIHRTIVTSLLIRCNVHPVGFVLLALWAWSMTDSNCTQRRGDYTAGWFSECQCRFCLLQALMFLLACKSPDSLAANHTQDKEKPLNALSFKNVCNH